MGLTAYLSIELCILFFPLTGSFLSSLLILEPLQYFITIYQEPVYVSLPLDNSSLCVPALSGLYS